MIKHQDCSLHIPDSTIENWQEIVDLLAAIAQIPAGLIMRVIEEDISVFVTSQGEGNPYELGSSEKVWDSGLYCETVIKTQNRLLIPNALEDNDWKDNPDVKLNMISYLGFPINMPNGKPFGTICILDNKENHYNETTIKLVDRFRKIVESDLDILYANAVLGDANKRLSDYLDEINALRGIVKICSNCKSIQDKNEEWKPVEHYLIKHPVAEFSHGICPECLKKIYSQFTD